MNKAPAPLWRRLWPLAGLVLAAHLALLQGGWRAWTPTRDRWVQTFTTRTISVAPPRAQAEASPAPPVQPPPAAVARKAPPAPAPKKEAETPQAAAAPVPAESPAAAAPPALAASDAAPATAATPFVPKVIGVPQPSVMRYEVTVRTRGFSLGGEARLDWWHNGQQYDLKLSLSAPGVRDRVQHSVGEITEEDWPPAASRTSRAGSRPRTSTARAEG
ncbi:hypothetical protein [Ramlibacter montanisoli]|uniref:hypothetical protein n=1 Tax=Ramlibacter montanisoli TaxID=2732512 RepID=UPI00209C19D8|nr:hypothetical protein [Ramlibacter montanisoli]